MAFGCGCGLGKSLSANSPKQRQEGARFALVTLTAINLLNFASRYIPGALKEPIKADLHLTDTQTSLAATGMIVVYMAFAMVFGMLADKEILDRRKILAAGVVFWSIMTALAGLAHNFWTLVLFRALVGVGEAAYGTIATPMIADFYPKEERNYAFAVFLLAGPVGGALGFGIGAVVGSIAGWRIAFVVCGLPGVVVAYFILMMNDPVRGINDDDTANDATPERSSEDGLSKEKPKEESILQDLKSLLTNKYYMVATAGCICTTFAIGGIADWIDAYLMRYVGASLASAGMVVGAITVVGGVGGTMMGAKAAEYFNSRVKSAFFLVPALCQLPAAVFCFVLLNTHGSASSAYLLLFLAQIFMFTYTSPINTLTINSVPVRLRARAMGIQIFLAHLLGDLISPPIIGAISDSTGSLKRGMQVTWAAMLLSGVCWLAGYRFLPALDQNDDAMSEASAIAKEKLISYGGSKKI